MGSWSSPATASAVRLRVRVRPRLRHRRPRRGRGSWPPRRPWLPRSPSSDPRLARPAPTGPHVVDSRQTPCPRSRPSNRLWPADAMPTGGRGAAPAAHPTTHGWEFIVNEVPARALWYQGITLSDHLGLAAPLLRAAGTGPPCPDAAPHRPGRGADLRRVVRGQAGLIAGAAAVLVSGRAWMGGVAVPGRGPVVAADPSRPARGEPTSGVGDRLGRPLRDLRVSVTDRCNFLVPA